jgi:hypothetical protein
MNSYRSKSVVLTLVALTALAQPAFSQATQANLSKEGYFSGRGAYTGHPADVIGEGVPTVVDRTMTNAAVIDASDAAAMQQRPVVQPAANTFWVPRWPTRVHYWRVF